MLLHLLPFLNFGRILPSTFPFRIKYKWYILNLNLTERNNGPKINLLGLMDLHPVTVFVYRYSLLEMTALSNAK